MAISIDAVRAHPEYQAMLANLTAVQARCTELLGELRAYREEDRRDAEDAAAALKEFRASGEPSVPLSALADGAAPSALDNPFSMDPDVFHAWLSTPMTEGERRAFDALGSKKYPVAEPKPRAVLVSGPSRGTERCSECAMAVPLHKVSCSHCPGNADGPPATAPIPLLLTCPVCKARHIDEGAFATKVHHTHACQGCGHVWRPAVPPTVGVRHLPGFKNAKPAKVEPMADANARKVADLIVVVRPFAEFYKGICASRVGFGVVPVPRQVVAVTVHGKTWEVESESFRRAHRACEIYDPDFRPEIVK
jgi:rubredoxin